MMKRLLALLLVLAAASPALANEFYTHSGYPATNSSGTSAGMRAELDLIAAGFNLLPTLSGNTSKAVIVNGGGTGLTTTTGTLALDGNFAISGAFSTVLTVTGNTALTLPTTGSLATLAGIEAFTNKTLTSPTISNPTFSGTASGTLTSLGLNAPLIASIINGGTLTLPSGTDTLVGRATTDTLTNKTLTAPIINGGTITAPTLSGSFIGTYTLAGTPTITAPAISAPAFSGTATGSLTSLALTNAALTTSTVAADPTATLGIASKSYVDHPAYAAYSANATIGAFTHTASLSGASFTLTLNTAVGHAGQIITVIHAGTSLTQVYTIDGAGSETIDGTTTYLLYTNGERLTMVSDGTNWLLTDHQAKTLWADVGVMTITGTTSDPTKPTTPDIDKVYWRRDGSTVYLRYILQISSAAGSAAGSGNYLFALPTNISFDTTILTPVATAMATATRSESSASYLAGTGFAPADSTNMSSAFFFAYDTTHFQVQIMEIADGGTASAGTLGNTNHPVTNGESAYNFELSARAANWRP